MNLPKPKLLGQARGLIPLRRMSYKTEGADVAYTRDYILFHKKRHPLEMGVEEIRSYLTHLAVEMLPRRRKTSHLIRQLL